MDNAFARRMKELRRQKGLTQKQAAAGLGISQALLSHYEKGVRECGLDFIIKAAGFYGVTADDLLGLNTDGRETAEPMSAAVRALLAAGRKNPQWQSDARAMLGLCCAELYAGLTGESPADALCRRRAEDALRLSLLQADKSEIPLPASEDSDGMQLQDVLNEAKGRYDKE